MSLTLTAARRKNTVYRPKPPALLDAAVTSPNVSHPVFWQFRRLIRFSRAFSDLAHACLFSVSRCTAARSVNLRPAPFATLPCSR